VKVLLSRWQFGVTITYHFLFVPLTIGLSLLVAVMQVLAQARRPHHHGSPPRGPGRWRAHPSPDRGTPG
jgi:hypothetical protein